MKAKALVTTTSPSPAGAPFFLSTTEPEAASITARLPRLASVGPIELRIDSSGGPSAIAILE